MMPKQSRGESIPSFERTHFARRSTSNRYAARDDVVRRVLSANRRLSGFYRIALLKGRFETTHRCRKIEAQFRAERHSRINMPKRADSGRTRDQLSPRSTASCADAREYGHEIPQSHENTRQAGVQYMLGRISIRTSPRSRR